MYYEWREALRLDAQATKLEDKERIEFEVNLASNTPEPSDLIKSGQKPIFKDRSRTDIESPKAKRMVYANNNQHWQEPLKDNIKRPTHKNATSNDSTSSNISLQELARANADYYGTRSPVRKSVKSMGRYGSSTVELQQWGDRYNGYYHDELSE